MSVLALVLTFALAGQVTPDYRYGDPAAAGGQLPGRATLPRDISPPPPLTPSVRAAPTTKPEDYGYRTEAPPPRTNSPPVGTVPTAPVTNIKPAVMLQAMLTPPPGSRLTGRPVHLSEVLAGASTRPEQAYRVEAYWDLCSSVADYYLGVREQDELQRLRATVTNIGPVWQQAASEIGVRIGTSERAAIASQYRLASLMGRAEASRLPLPADLPHCGDYYARYDQVFAGRPSPEAQQLTELLPLRYQELTDATAAVTRAEEFLGAIASQRNASSDGTGTLRALELLALRRRAFVPEVVRDYNRRIARYTELASPGQIDSDRLIGMLIKREAANTATRPSTTAPPYNRQSLSPSETPPRTFDEHWVPAGGEVSSAARGATKRSHLLR